MPWSVGGSLIPCAVQVSNRSIINSLLVAHFTINPRSDDVGSNIHVVMLRLGDCRGEICRAAQGDYCAKDQNKSENARQCQC